MGHVPRGSPDPTLWTIYKNVTDLDIIWYSAIFASSNWGKSKSSSAVVRLEKKRHKIIKPRHSDELAKEFLDRRLDLKGNVNT